MKLIIHGGFFSEASQSETIKKAKQDALSTIVRDAYRYLASHSALDTCVYAVSLLEDNSLFNAGIGSMIQSDGKIRMSASLMDGTNQKFSGVINIENIKNPIFLARDLMQEDDRVLSGEGAIQYARNKGYDSFSTETEERRREYESKIQSTGLGTVGCVAIDKDERLAAATSTGGKGFEIPCRVSDSATVAGNYANAHCAVSLTGVGEDIVSGAIAAKIVTRVTDGMSIQEAFDKTFLEFKEIDGFAGAIAIDRHGNIYHQDSYPTMVYASYDGTILEIFY